MESFNKVLYFILGLVVVLVFIIVISGRFNLGKTFRPLANISPSPTPRAQDRQGFFGLFGPKQPSATPSPHSRQVTPTPSFLLPTTVPGGQTGTVQTIPATGAPTQILLLAIPTLAAGFSLRKRR